jgi:hypothetical protein
VKKNGLFKATSILAACWVGLGMPANGYAACYGGWKAGTPCVKAGVQSSVYVGCGNEQVGLDTITADNSAPSVQPTTAITGTPGHTGLANTFTVTVVDFTETYPDLDDCSMQTDSWWEEIWCAGKIPDNFSPACVG